MISTTSMPPPYQKTQHGQILLHAMVVHQWLHVVDIPFIVARR
jgi:hypothetical protein